MQNELGFYILGGFILLIIALLIPLIILHKQGKKAWLREVFDWVLVVSPAIFLILIDKWRWGPSIGDNPMQDLPYSWFHFLFVGLMIAGAYGLYRLSKIVPHNSVYPRLTTVDITILKIGFFLLFIELYKQFSYATLLTSYQWYLFPFQFCSVPIYVCLINPWLKPGKLKTAGYNFLAIYGFIAGMSVMALPTTVFVPQVSISIHTMLWHGMMVIIGTYLLSQQNIGKSSGQVIGASYVLYGFIGIALFINVVLHYAAPFIGLNAFFLSPWEAAHIPIIRIAYDTLLLTHGQTIAWLAYLICYVLLFSLGGWAVYGFRRLYLQMRGRLDKKTLQLQINPDK